MMRLHYYLSRQNVLAVYLSVSFCLLFLSFLLIVKEPIENGVSRDSTRSHHEDPEA